MYLRWERLEKKERCMHDLCQKWKSLKIGKSKLFKMLRGYQQSPGKNRNIMDILKYETAQCIPFNVYYIFYVSGKCFFSISHVNSLSNTIFHRNKTRMKFLLSTTKISIILKYSKEIRSMKDKFLVFLSHS